MWQKGLFLIVGIAAVVVVFKISWFWSLFIIPIVVLLTADILSSFFKKKN